MYVPKFQLSKKILQLQNHKRNQSSIQLFHLCTHEFLFRVQMSLMHISLTYSSTSISLKSSICLIGDMNE